MVEAEGARVTQRATDATGEYTLGVDEFGPKCKNY